MGKPGGKGAAEVVARKKKKRLTRREPRNNPFEVRINRRKHDVLGQKVKSGRGLPGVARSRAVQKVPSRVKTPKFISISVSLRSEEEDPATGVSVQAQDGTSI